MICTRWGTVILPRLNLSGAPRVRLRQLTLGRRRGEIQIGRGPWTTFDITGQCAEVHIAGSGIDADNQRKPDYRRNKVQAPLYRV